MARENHTENTVVTQIRLPAGLHEYIRKEASENALSLNAMMIVLMAIGRKIFNDPAVAHRYVDAARTGKQPGAEKTQSESSCSGSAARQSL